MGVAGPDAVSTTDVLNFKLLLCKPFSLPLSFADQLYCYIAIYCYIGIALSFADQLLLPLQEWIGEISSFARLQLDA